MYVKIYNNIIYLGKITLAGPLVSGLVTVFNCTATPLCMYFYTAVSGDTAMSV